MYGGGAIRADKFRGRINKFNAPAGVCAMCVLIKWILAWRFICSLKLFVNSTLKLKSMAFGIIIFSFASSALYQLKYPEFDMQSKYFYLFSSPSQAKNVYRHACYLRSRWNHCDIASLCLIGTVKMYIYGNKLKSSFQAETSVC